MKIDIITIFPNIFDSYFSESIIKRAKEKGVVEINIHYLRDYTNDKHQTVDDKPFSGSAGMILKIEPIDKAINAIKTKDSYIIAMSAKGGTFKQSKAIELSKKSHLIILCGRYEGFDHRVEEFLVDENISIGNFVLTGGELPAMLIADSIIRLLPGAVGNEDSPITDSFYTDDNTIQHPVYTRPAKYVAIDGRKMNVPDILLSGNHQEIENWKQKMSKAKKIS